MEKAKLDIPQGTLDLMILTILAREPMHGYGISQKLAALSRDSFQVNPGSLFPAFRSRFSRFSSRSVKPVCGVPGTVGNPLIRKRTDSQLCCRL